jgi:hypothetical protein
MKNFKKVVTWIILTGILLISMNFSAYAHQDNNDNIPELLIDYSIKSNIDSKNEIVVPMGTPKHIWNLISITNGWYLYRCYEHVDGPHDKLNYGPLPDDQLIEF